MPDNLEQRAAAFLALAEKATTYNLPNGERKPWSESIEDFYSLYLAARNDAPALIADLLAELALATVATPATAPEVKP